MKQRNIAAETKVWSDKPQGRRPRAVPVDADKRLGVRLCHALPLKNPHAKMLRFAVVHQRRGARVDESTCLESMRPGNGTVGSNPTLSAKNAVDSLGRCRSSQQAVALRRCGQGLIDTSSEGIPVRQAVKESRYNKSRPLPLSF